MCLCISYNNDVLCTAFSFGSCFILPRPVRVTTKPFPHYIAQVPHYVIHFSPQCSDGYPHYIRKAPVALSNAGVLVGHMGRIPALLLHTEREPSTAVKSKTEILRQEWQIDSILESVRCCSRSVVRWSVVFGLWFGVGEFRLSLIVSLCLSSVLLSLPSSLCTPHAVLRKLLPSRLVGLIRRGPTACILSLCLCIPPAGWRPFKTPKRQQRR